MRPHNLLYSTKVFADQARETRAGTVAQQHIYLVLRTPQPMHTLSPLSLSLRIDLQRALLPLDGLVDLGYIDDKRAWTLSKRFCRSYYKTDLASHGSTDDVFDDELEEERCDAVVFALTVHHCIFAAWHPPTSRSVH